MNAKTNGTPEVVALASGRFGYRQFNGEVVGSYLDREEAAEVMAHYIRECRADGSLPATSSAPQAGTPITHLEAARVLLAQAECSIREPFAPLPALAAFDALAAKAAALDALVEAATVLFHESNTLEGMRGARDPHKVAALTAALTAAKAAQVSK